MRVREENLLGGKTKIKSMITIKQGDITKEKCDAIVNPANSKGLMGGGVALVIKRAGGINIEREAMLKSPIEVGEAVLTSAGRLPCRYVIHAPTMENPAQRTTPEDVEKAMKAALRLAESEGLRRIAVPGMGTGVGGVYYGDAAEVMVKEALKHPKLDIVFIDTEREMVEAWKRELEKRKNNT